MVSDLTDPCFICGSTEKTHLNAAKDLLHGFEGEFDLYTCSGCGVVSIYPQLQSNEIEKYYPEDYIAFPIAIDEEEKWAVRKDRQRGVDRRCKFTIERSGLETGSILDVGCATGVFLDGMRQRGWLTWGVEPSDFAANYAKKKLGLNIKHGYLSAGLFPDSNFDVVTLWDVFEHLPDPSETLGYIHKVMKPNGKLLITTPNSKSWDRKLFKDTWAGWDVPRHYHVYDQQALILLLEQHGFSFSEIKSFTGRQGAAAISIEFWLKKKGITEKTRKNIIKFYNSYFCRLLTYPYFLVLDGINRSSSMTVVFTRSNSKVVKKDQQ